MCVATFYIQSIALFLFSLFFFFNDTATTEIYTLSLHDALPISLHRGRLAHPGGGRCDPRPREPLRALRRSEEHTSELQSQSNLVCRLLLEKKKKYDYLLPYLLILLSISAPSSTPPFTISVSHPF